MSDDPTPQPEQTPPAAEPGPATEAATTPAPATEDAATTSPAKPRLSPIERMELMSARLRATAEQARYWREQAERAAKPPEKPSEPPAAPAQPKRDQFENPDDYDAALVQWATDTALHKQRAENEAAERQRREAEAKTAAERRQQEEIGRIHQDWASKRSAFLADHPDYADIAEADPDDGGPVITQSMAAAIMIAENGPEIAYWLGQNTDEAERIAKMTDPAKQMFEVARLSGRLSGNGARPPAPPAPITPLRGVNSGATRKSPEQETPDEYAARRRAERKAAGVSQW